MENRKKSPKNTKEFLWTNHAVGKMKQYGLSEQKVRGAIFRPNRKEEGIAPKTIAVMQNAGSKKHPYEIWVMYQIAKVKNEKLKMKIFLPSQKKIISAWKYPGTSPKKNPIPESILNELENIL